MPPIERRRASDSKTAAELTQDFIDETRREFKRLNDHLWIRWLVVVVALILAGFVTYFYSHKTNRIAAEGKALATSIQQDRHAMIFRQCMDQNSRHDETIRRLFDALRTIEKDLPPGTTARQLKESVDANVALIDALAPRIAVGKPPGAEARGCNQKADLAAPLGTVGR